jgi:hypothetical protein
VGRSFYVKRDYVILELKNPYKSKDYFFALYASFCRLNQASLGSQNAAEVKKVTSRMMGPFYYFGAVKSRAVGR